MTPNPYALQNPNPFLSRTDVGALIPNTVAPGLTGIFGGGLGSLSWVRGSLQQSLGPLQNISELANELRRDAEYRRVMTVKSRRPKLPWAYWQFKNGKIAPLSGPRELPFDMDWDLAWDRSLGCYVCYASR